MSGHVRKYTTRSGKERWEVRWDLPPGATGERRQRSKSGFPTRREAQRFLRERLGAQDRGLADVSTRITVTEFLTSWLDAKRLRATTRDNYWTCLLVHAVPRIGGIKLVDLDHHALDRLYRNLEGHGKAAGGCRTAGITCPANRCSPSRHAGLSIKSVQLVHGALRTALQDAVRDGLLLRNPADLAQAPRRTSAQRRVTSDQIWTAAQARQFLHHIHGDRLEALWALALGTGLRRAELVGLAWDHVDLDAATVEIKRTTTTVRGQAVLSSGKTSAAHRRLHLDEPLPSLLRAHRARQDREHRDAGLPPADHVFTDPAGRPLHPGRLSKGFQALARELGLPPVGIHGLRHTAATLMQVTGVASDASSGVWCDRVIVAM